MYANAQIHRKPHPTDEHKNQIGYKIRNHNGQISLNIGVAPNISVHTAEDSPGHQHNHQGRQTGEVQLPVEDDGMQAQNADQRSHII